MSSTILYNSCCSFKLLFETINVKLPLLKLNLFNAQNQDTIHQTTHDQY